MPAITLNLKEAMSLKPIPEDTYEAEVVAIDAVATGPKAQYLPVQVAITDGEHEGRKFYINLPIEGKGAGIFVDFWNKVLDTDYDVDELDELALDPDDLMGGSLRIITKTEEYPEDSGEFRSNVARTLSAA